MFKPLLLKNSIQKYAWGSHSAIQQLMGKDLTDEPWAELWMGAHPKAPSQVFADGEWVDLQDLVDRFPEEILGSRTAERFNNTLPFLFKVLAAEQPLSIQAHPNAAQAKSGFERESEAGIDINSPIRNYRDNHHKPECICALTPFTGLKGFRKISSTLAMTRMYCAGTLAEEIRTLERKRDLKRFFQSLMELPEFRKEAVIREAVHAAKNRSSQDFISQWVHSLYRQYPADIGVISPLFLNLFCLEPGQALFLPAGELHAYLDGLGIELMANSDNVLRGGLTPKHVDVPELLKVLNFAESDVEILVPETVSGGEGRYPSFAEEFQLAKLRVSDTETYISPEKRSVEILLFTHGFARLDGLQGTDEPLALKKGDSVLIPAAAPAYHLTGDARFYKACVPL